MNLVSRIKAVAVLALVSAGVVSAQFNVPTNARVDALAGAHVSDISGIYRYPVQMIGYLDHIQATWGQGFVGIKSVSDAFSFGVLANQGSMDTAFTAAASNRLNDYFNNNLFDDNIVIPHLLLGFDLGAAAIGADVFFEYAGYSADNLSGSIVNPGVRLSGRFGVADAEVMAKIGLSFPSISASGGNNGKLSSDEGLYIEAGAEAGMPLGGADWLLGLCYTRSGRRFQLGTAVDQNAMAYSLLNVYLGVEFNFVETAVAVLGYSFNRNAVITTQPDANGNASQSNPINHWHVISAAVENAWDNAWIFDSVYLRGGALYTITSTGGKTSAPDTDYSQPAKHSAVQPTIGVGVSKAFITLDLALNPGSWGGAFTGPDVALVTATVKF